MPFRRDLPPDEYCRGTRPSHAARCRPFLNSLASPTAATIAVAVIGPTPSMAVIFLHRAERFMNALIQPRPAQCAPRAHARAAATPSSASDTASEFALARLEYLGHGAVERRGGLGNRDAAFAEHTPDLVDDRGALMDQQPRTRCAASMSCWSTDFTVTNRIAGRHAASQSPRHHCGRSCSSSRRARHIAG